MWKKIIADNSCECPPWYCRILCRLSHFTLMRIPWGGWLISSLFRGAETEVDRKAQILWLGWKSNSVRNWDSSTGKLTAAPYCLPFCGSCQLGRVCFSLLLCLCVLWSCASATEISLPPSVYFEREKQRCDTKKEIVCDFTETPRREDLGIIVLDEFLGR